MNINNMDERLQISLGNKSDVGKVRTKNEDYMEIFKCSFGEVFVVCDGMGGHIGGEVASRLSVFTIKEFMTENPKGIKGTSQLIAEALNSANNALHNKTKENPDLKGMGTTCVILVLNDGIAYFGNVGDSRLYLVRGNNIYQLTKDQSFVQELVNQGIISYEEAENHPRKNEILQALGVNLKIEPQLNPGGMKIYKNDRFILCSDGLSGMVKDRDILNIVGQSPAMDACEKLVTLANINGGTDNITVQVAHILNGEVLPDDLRNAPPPGAVLKDSGSIPETASTREMTGRIAGIESPPPPPKKSGLIYFIIGGLILLILLLFAVWWFFLRSNNDSEEIKSTEKIQVDENKPEYKSISEKLNGFLKEKLYRGKNIDNNLIPPPDIIINKFIYKTDKDAQPKEIGFNELKNDIRTRDIWLNNLKITSLKDNIYFYRMELKIGNSNIQTYELLVNRLEDDKLEIKEISYYMPPPPPQKEEDPAQKQKAPPGQDETKKEENKNDGNKNDGDKNDGNVIEKTKDKIEKEVDKAKEKIEEKLPDIKKEK